MCNFFQFFFHQRVSLQFFWSFATERMLKSPKGSSLSVFFGIVRLFSDIFFGLFENPVCCKISKKNEGDPLETFKKSENRARNWFRKAIRQFLAQLLLCHISFLRNFSIFYRNFHRFFIKIASETQEGHLYILEIYALFRDL